MNGWVSERKQQPQQSANAEYQYFCSQPIQFRHFTQSVKRQQKGQTTKISTISWMRDFLWKFCRKIITMIRRRRRIWKTTKKSKSPDLKKRCWGWSTLWKGRKFSVCSNVCNATEILSGVFWVLRNFFFKYCSKEPIDPSEPEIKEYFSKKKISENDQRKIYKISQLFKDFHSYKHVCLRIFSKGHQSYKLEFFGDNFSSARIFFIFQGL